MFIHDLKEIITSKLYKGGDLVSGDEIAISEECIQEVCKRFAGERVYIPHSHINKEERNEKIASEYTGKDVGRLAKKYSVSKRLVYYIVNNAANV